MYSMQACAIFFIHLSLVEGLAGGGRGEGREEKEGEGERRERERGEGGTREMKRERGVQEEREGRAYANRHLKLKTSSCWELSQDSLWLNPGVDLL